MSVASMPAPSVQRTAPANAAALVPASADGPISSAEAERPLAFACEGEQLLGVLHAAAGELGLVVVVGGPQVRAGSHRLFVQMARALAAAGHPVLRFDVRGMGDSSGAQRTFEHITPDIGASIDALMAAQPQLRRVVLWGLCDGASAALLYLNERTDPRIAGLCLLNPWVRSEQTLAQARVKHYYLQRLRQPAFWRKLFSGAVSPGALAGWWRQVKAAGGSGKPQTHAQAANPPFQKRMLAAWRQFAKPVLVLLSADDITAQEFNQHAALTPGWGLGELSTRVSTNHLTRADHTCSSNHAKAGAIELVVGWMGQLSNTVGTSSCERPGGI